MTGIIPWHPVRRTLSGLSLIYTSDCYSRGREHLARCRRDSSLLAQTTTRVANSRSKVHWRITPGHEHPRGKSRVLLGDVRERTDAVSAESAEPPPRPGEDSYFTEASSSVRPRGTNVSSCWNSQAQNPAHVRFTSYDSEPQATLLIIFCVYIHMLCVCVCTYRCTYRCTQM